MRLAFPNGEHDEVSVGKGTLTIGSSPGDNVKLDSSEVEPGHAVIIVDRRGITLNVDAKAGEVAVNGRRVVEKAILRLGDNLEIGPVSMVLRADDAQMLSPDRGSRPPKPAGSSASAKYHLRGLSGYHQGRVIPLRGAVTLGGADGCDLVIPDSGLASELARFEVDGGAVYVRPLSDASLEINGNLVGEVVLNPGDQLTFGEHRFLLETPGFVPGKIYAGAAAENQVSNTQVFSSPVVGEERPDAGSQEVGFRAQAGSRDALVVAVCALLSAAMLIWLFFFS